MKFWYGFLCAVVRAAMALWHPVFRVTGREHIPEGPCVIFGNHVGMADPIWTIFAMRNGKFFRILAKEQLLRLPVLGRFLRWIGVIGVKRGEGDLNAVKQALKALKNGEKLLVYPEGTRVRGARIQAKTGAVLLAQRAGCPILPVYIQRKRRPWGPLRMVIGAPCAVETAGAHPTAEELRQETDRLMDLVYEMGRAIG